MKVYLVGGAVRDKLLGLPVKERDYVVVGATEQEMRDLGFRPVGRDFPVFLHPETSEEFALARTERKTGPGHQGFVCHASPDVTLEEDLLRRDLTINAIAEDDDGKLIDPYGGKADLEQRVLRHVSAAFTEDPLRILRVAMFRARFPDFSVHPSLMALMQTMVDRGDLNELTPERVLLELDKALAAAAPAAFFQLLDELGANRLLWPEITREAISELAACRSTDPDARFAVLFRAQDEKAVRQFCERYRASSHRQEITVLMVNHLDTWRSLDQLDAKAIVDLLAATDAIRKSARFLAFHQVCRELTGDDPDWPRWQQLAASVRAKDVDTDLTGPALGEAIRARQIQVIAEQRA